jgi:hypothetical protein
VKRLLLASTILIAGCATQPAPQPIPYVPATVTNPPPKPIDAGPDPVAALPEEIRIAYAQPNPPVLHDGITTIYPYDPHKQPTINCAILRVTEIVLGAGETVKANNLGIGDVCDGQSRPLTIAYWLSPPRPASPLTWWW